jgi:hypothetical protein
MNREWIRILKKDHRKVMNWVMKNPFSGKSLWPGWQNRKHHSLYFHPCIIDWEYCEHYKRDPDERCSYCPVARIRENGSIECCHGYMWEFEQAIEVHDRKRVIEFAEKIRDLPWENPHDVRTRWHSARVIRHDREEEYRFVYWTEPIHMSVAV